MSRSLLIRQSALGFAALLWVAGPIPSGRAAIVDAGYDLLHTTTAFLVAPGGPYTFTGLPLGTYDFGGAIGVKSVGNADTIIQRVSPPAITTPGVFDLQVDALQLFDATHNLFAVLDPLGLNTGTVTVNDDGTWVNHFTVTFNVYYGSIGGLIVMHDVSKTFDGHGWWSSTPGSGEVLIPGVNDFSDGNNFYLVGPGLHDDGHGSYHNVTSTPEVSTALSGMAAAVLCGLFVLRHHPRNRSH